MKPKLIVVLLLIVLLPLALLAWLGVRVSRDEQEMERHRLSALLQDKLKDTDRAISEFLQQRERELSRAMELPQTNTESLRQLARENPFIGQVVLLAPDGKILHPPVASAELTDAERRFLVRAQRMLEDKELARSNSEAGGSSASIAPAQGWYAWHWDNGLNLIFWRRDARGNVMGVEVNRARLLADIVARLPETNPADPALPGASVSLADSNGGEIYRWGQYARAERQEPAASLALSAPLNSWRLDYYSSPEFMESGLKRSALLNVTAVCFAMAVALIGLALYFYREHAREMREAAQRLDFVNRVSHELKTPLTNIRLYAELLEQELLRAVPTAEGGSAPDPKALQHVDVIVSESQRLSRLIGNVLTFAQQQRNSLALHPRPGCVDEIIAAAIEQFRPAFAAKEIHLEFSGNARETVVVDGDALGQILANLFSNVEKYGADGKRIDISSAHSGDRITITVSDGGPGIPKREAERIFQPFQRLSDKLSDGVTGTGIGLTIARELARMHGGDVVLEESTLGAKFRITIRTLAVGQAFLPAGQTGMAGATDVRIETPRPNLADGGAA